MKCFSCLGKGCVVCSNTGVHTVYNVRETNERYTPKYIIDAARATMGSIDTDPATNDFANLTVGADTTYDYKQNGLKQPWHGNIWCNPPFGLVPAYGRGYQQLFLEHGIEEMKAGRAKQLMYLLDAHVIYNPHFRQYLHCLVCIYSGRMSFYDRRGQDHLSFGNVILYIGGNRLPFIEQFSRFGAIVRAVNALDI